jgi:predicted negative regulator of RcsB-dependent stress response
MKSQHRHELETNWLAKRLNVVIEQSRPYASTVAGIAVAVVLAILAWTYFAGSSSVRHSEAWNSFNEAVLERQPDVERLRVLAEEHPGTTMQQLSDVTWADSQVWLAARNYLYDRTGSMEALEKATSRYQSVLGTSKDERLLNRAQLGMARIYEIRGELDKAREEYLKVKGGNETYAKAQAERLATPESKETYAWLAKAQPVRPRSASTPGVPGKEPDFSAADLALPGETPGGAPAGTPADGESIEKLLEGLQLDLGEVDEKNDPYKLPEGTPAVPGSPPAEQPPAQSETQPTSPPAQSETPPAQEAGTSEGTTDSQTDNANADSGPSAH